MNGKHTRALDSTSAFNKWNDIKSAMRNNKIAVLAIQETHLSEEQAATVQDMYQHDIHIIHSASPVNPTASAGVAFVLNKRLLNTSEEKYKVQTLIPGRAILIELKWHNDDIVTILNLYAPADRDKQPEFWESLTRLWQPDNSEDENATPNIAKPDIVLGDFNIVEDVTDRYPRDEEEISSDAAEALMDFRLTLGISDTWRELYPEEKVYTFTRGASTRSRLDRIYAAYHVEQLLSEWQHDSSQIHSDHALVTTKYSPLSAPHVGPGRFAIKQWMTRNKRFLDMIEEEGMKHQQEAERLGDDRTPDRNLQALNKSLKGEFTRIAKKEGREQANRMRIKSDGLRAEIWKIENDPDRNEDPEAMGEAAMLKKELEFLEHKTRKQTREDARTKHENESEKPGKYLSNLGKKPAHRNPTFRLYDPAAPDEVKTRSTDMAELGREYHSRIQQRTAEDPSATQSKDTRDKHVLPTVPENQKLSDEEADSLDTRISEEDVENALKASKSLSSPGPDGIPFELWKELKARHVLRQKNNQPGFDVIKWLTLVFNDVENHGVLQGCEFAEGWMQPIYKKKDPANIANYRPITLLNTDYKLMTKVLSIKLTQVAPTMIHPDQAGFMPGRSIFDHIRLAQTMISFAETIKDQDGYIIALDQEKAYDRIDHDYLWAAMRNFRVPESFIKTVESLYANAHTKVAINGILSDPFQVTRGVRQGDPLSCLLFNMAIEPLACMLRKNEELSGYEITGKEIEKLIINLFADDAVVFLKKGDRFDTLQSALDTWCRASGAKFNTEKTEILPIGSKEHREHTINTRRIHPEDHTIPDNVHILKDGESFRSLGADLGNHHDETSKWNPHVEKIQARFDTWSKRKPSLFAKKHIVQQVVFGVTQFKAKAQGMPKTIEQRINKAIRNFIWDGKQPTVNEETLGLPLDEGGLNMPSLQARNEAIQVMWLKAYLTLSDRRPLWAFVLDELIREKIPPNHNNDIELVNAFLQRWNIPDAGDRVKHLPPQAREMLKTANKYGANFNAIKLSEDLQGELPAWLHLGAMPRAYHALKTSCLKEHHKISTMRDLLRLATRHRTPGHWNNARCKCTDCMKDKKDHCQRPWKCSQNADEILAKIHKNFNMSNAPPKDNLTHTTRRVERFKQVNPSDESITFDPSVTMKNSLDEGFRIFAKSTSINLEPANRPLNSRGINAVWEHVTAYTAGTCKHPNSSQATAGAGIWIEENSPYNEATKVPQTLAQTQATGEMLAVVLLLQKIENFKPLTIRTSSKQIIDGATKHLKRWEDQGYIGIKNSDLWRALAYQLRIRSATTSFRLTRDHPEESNEFRAPLKEAIKAAKTGIEQPAQREITLEVPKKWTLDGAKTNAMTQSLATKAIKEWKTPAPRRLTVERVDMAKDAIKDLKGTNGNSETIWKGATKLDALTVKTRSFQWRIMHRALRIGPHFERMQEPWKSWAKCPCGESSESLEHIMLECDAEGARELVWNMAKDIWPGEESDWPDLNPGILYACGSIPLKSQRENTQRGRQTTRQSEQEEETNEAEVDPRCAEPSRSQRAAGLTRLLNILISESMYMIWLLRNERNIDSKEHSKQEIARRWRARITTRMNDDRNKARRNCPGKKQNKLILKTKATWNGTLHEEKNLPSHWVTPREFLVGIRPPKSDRIRALLGAPP
jgi:exonuclease III